MTSRLLREIASTAPDPYHPDSWTGDVDGMLRAFTRLELAGLAERIGGRFGLTEEGEQVVDRLTA